MVDADAPARNRGLLSYAVFLENRIMKSPAPHNALVSVLLRV